jgi:hypothetical protein
LKVFILNANFVISQDLDRPCLDKHYCKWQWLAHYNSATQSDYLV